MKKINTVRGIRDITYPDSSIWNEIIRTSESILESYGYRKIFLPVVEYADLFSRSIGDDTDIVSKEMYVFKDKKGRKLALRPEGTAGAARAMIENDLLRGRIREKIYYFGPMFRYERPQEGRYRQFYQIGCEVFGSADSRQDAELTALADEILNAAEIKDKQLIINTVGCENCRREYRKEVKSYLKQKVKNLCPDCKRRLGTNTLRILDCKNKKCRRIIKYVPVIKDFLCKDCADFFDEYRELLIKKEIDFEIDYSLVRGLDYYTGPVFELKAGIDTVVAGGRYNRLVKQLGGPDVPACGWALGMERLFIASNLKKNSIPGVYLAAFKGADTEKCRKTADYLRDKGLSVEEDYD
ncbi:MAG: histidine--tRNA ligase, partial [Elusimicrobiota bacterium]